MYDEIFIQVLDADIHHWRFPKRGAKKSEEEQVHNHQRISSKCDTKKEVAENERRQCHSTA